MVFVTYELLNWLSSFHMLLKINQNCNPRKFANMNYVKRIRKLLYDMWHYVVGALPEHTEHSYIDCYHYKHTNRANH